MCSHLAERNRTNCVAYRTPQFFRARAVLGEERRRDFKGRIGHYSSLLTPFLARNEILSPAG